MVTMSIVDYFIICSLINTALWIVAFILLFKDREHGREVIGGSSLSSPGVFAMIFIGFLWLLYIHNKIGFLPYGPDTACYTYKWNYLRLHGHWDLFIGRKTNPYYTFFHTASIMTYILGSLMNSLQLGYMAYLLALLTLVMLASFILSRKLLKNIGPQFIIGVLVILIFLGTPMLLGSDALQQYVAMAMTLTAIMVMLILPRSSSKLITYTILVAVAVITHITFLALLLIMLAPLILRHNMRKHVFTYISIALGITIMYTVFSYAAYSIIPTLQHAVSSYFKYLYQSLSSEQPSTLAGAKRAVIVRAYHEIPQARFWVYSWTMLPSLGLAYVTFRSATLLGEFKLGAIKIKNVINFITKDYIFCVYLLAGVSMILGAISRFAGYDIFRYMAVSSYYALFLASVVTLYEITFRVLFKITKRKALGFLIISFLLTVCLYSGIQNPARTPWNGGLRLAPVTLTDRIELTPLAIYAPSTMRIYAWHDAYVPKELNPNSEIIGAGSYYPVHDILLSIANGKKVRIKEGPITLFIIPKIVIRDHTFKTYSIILNAHEHLVLIYC